MSAANGYTVVNRIEPGGRQSESLQMKIDLMVVSYFRGGGLSPYSHVVDLLNTRLKGTYGCAVTTVEIYPRLPVPEQLRPASDDFDSWQTALEKLPHITFQRKLKRVEIAFCSKHFNSTEMDDWNQWDNGQRIVPKISVEAIRLAGDELKEALQLIKKRTKPSDQFDVSTFLADVDAALGSVPTSMEEWNALAMSVEQKEQAIDDTKGPWEQLDIDWSEYHPKAREILDAPFYWDCLDDIAPHGNDTGAELLEAFRQCGRKKGISPICMDSDWS